MVAETLNISRFPAPGRPLLEDRHGRNVAIREQAGLRASALQRLVPAIRSEDLEAGGAGVCAQAAGAMAAWSMTS